MPGMGELRSSYRHTRPALVHAGFRVATMDLRGHGDSDATFAAYDDVAAGTDALALIEHLRQPAVLIGNSMRAGAAVWAAAEESHLIDGLVLIGPFVRNVPMNPLLGLIFRLAMSGPGPDGSGSPTYRNCHQESAKTTTTNTWTPSRRAWPGPAAPPPSRQPRGRATPRPKPDSTMSTCPPWSSWGPATPTSRTRRAKPTTWLTVSAERLSSPTVRATTQH